MKGVVTRGTSVWGGQRAPLRRVVLYLFVALIFVFLLLPNMIVVPLSVTDSIFLQFPPKGFTTRWYQDYFGVEGASHFGSTKRWIPSTLTSFQLGFLVMLAAVPLGTLASYGLVRGRFKGKAIINSIIITPLIVPILITAIALFFFLSKGFEGGFFTIGLRSFFRPMPAPNLPATPEIPHGGWITFIVIMVVLVAGTLVLMRLPDLMRSALKGKPLGIYESVRHWLPLLLIVEMPLLLLGLLKLLGEWTMMVLMFALGISALLLMVIPWIRRRPWEGRMFELQDKLGLWVPISVILVTVFFIDGYFAGNFDKIDGGLFKPDDPYPPLSGVSPGLFVAHVMLAVPYSVIILTATLRGVDVTLDQASATLGGGPFTTLRKVILPVMIPGVAAAAFFSFLISFDELLIALFLSTAQASTLPKVIFDGIRTEISPTIAAVSTLLVTLTIFMLAGAFFLQGFLKRRAGSGADS